MKHTYVLLQNAYGTPEMRKVWTEENMVQKWLDVEVAITRANAEVGIIPREAAEEICSKSTVKHLTPEMIARFKADAGHLIVSFIKAFADMCGPAGEFYHVGPTTQDILDTGLTLQIKEAYDLLLKDLYALEDVLVKLAQKHRDTVMMGRTHGQHAVPITFGFKAAVWATEIRDHIERLKEISKRLFVANVSAACGTNNTFTYLVGPEKTRQIQRMVAEQLGLGCPLADTHHRTDRFAEFVNVLALLVSTLGEMGLEVRDLQRTEVREVEEPFDSEKQYSSSTMPNKRNPEPSEWQEGLAKIARMNAAALMDIQMQHERDATRMAVEFSCIPETCLVAHAAIRQAIRIFGGLRVDVERMRENLFAQKDISMAELAMLKLYQKTGRKVTAHRIVHDVSMKAFEEGKTLREVLAEHPEARGLLTQEDIAEITDPTRYFGNAPQQVDEVVAFIKQRRIADGVE
ncbi:MAG: adenylosuccinate lyase [Bacillota bacterium]|nr:adenylosuccinate lyase [Bacillota bacterium]